MIKEDGTEFDIESVINAAINAAGYNLVTCGNCGEAFLHDAGKEGDLKCPHCESEDEQCHFPDMFY